MPHDILIATESELRLAVPLDLAAVDTVERGFAALAGEGVVMPPVLSMSLPGANGEVDIKTAFLPGFEGFAIKVSPGFFDNPKLGIPSLNGLMMLLSARTGLVEALFLDNGYLTDVRTAAAGAVAARYLAPADARVAGVMGTGVQARLQIVALHMVRPLDRVLVWGRDPSKAEACAADIERSLGVAARAERNPERLVAASDVVVTATPAREPILRGDWLHPRLHLTAMGSDQSEKNELEPGVLAAASVYVADRVSQCETLGELRSAIAAGSWRGGRPAELGEIITGRAPGRRSATDITIADLTGTGAQDTAIATLAYAACLKAGLGATIAA